MTSLPSRTLELLVREGEDAQEAFREHAKGRSHLFIPCDHRAIHEQLAELRSEALTFFELGSGAGVVTIMADLLGFEAYGAELEPWLVERSIEIAERMQSGAQFAEGTFVPAEYQDEVENLSSEFHTPTGGANALEEFGLELSDFDLLFAYPWPGDEVWLDELVRRHARADAQLLTYDVCEGFRLVRAGDLPGEAGE